jgi:phage recombination protein Bet
MSNLQKVEKQVSIWQNPQEIKTIFAPDLSESEFEYFCGLAQRFGADPFKREIWAMKYKKKDESGYHPAQVFLGRDFYARKAQESPNYEGHVVDAVYEKDTFDVQNGQPSHRYSTANRGKLIGAYCVVYVTHRKVPYYVFCELIEYKGTSPLWRDKPATMIKKVAEAQGLRGAFRGMLAGTYSEDEQWEGQIENQKIKENSVGYDDLGYKLEPEQLDQALILEVQNALNILCDLPINFDKEYTNKKEAFEKVMKRNPAFMWVDKKKLFVTNQYLQEKLLEFENIIQEQTGTPLQEQNDDKN